jgi:hypothetical protein
MTIADESSPSTGPELSATETSEPSTGPPSNQLTLFAEAFPVNRIRPLVNDWPETITETSGQNSGDASEQSDRDGSWPRTSQGFSLVMLDGSSGASFKTWPKAGTASNGTVFQRPQLAPLTAAIASGLLPTPKTPQGGGERSGDRAGTGDLAWMARTGSWPTPTASDAKSAGSRNPGSKAHAGVSLTDAVKFGNSHTPRQWSTPTARDANTLKKVMRGRGSFERGNELIQPLPVQAGGALNPPWVEWLMGYPLGWTDLEGSETQSSLKFQNG